MRLGNLTLAVLCLMGHGASAAATLPPGTRNQPDPEASQVQPRDVQGQANVNMRGLAGPGATKFGKRGLAASQARFLMLTARASDLEIMISNFVNAWHQLDSQRQFLIQQANAIRGQPGRDADVAHIEGQIRAIEDQQLQLFVETQRLQEQQRAVQAEIEEVRRVIAELNGNPFVIVPGSP